MLLTLKTKEGAASQGCRRPQEAGRDKEMDLPQGLQKERSPAGTLIIASETHFRETQFLTSRS